MHADVDVRVSVHTRVRPCAPGARLTLGARVPVCALQAGYVRCVREALATAKVRMWAQRGSVGLMWGAVYGC